MFPLKVAYDRINADVLNPLLVDDEGRDPALGYEALEARAPSAEELLGAPLGEEGGEAGLEPAIEAPATEFEPLSPVAEEEHVDIASPLGPRDDREPDSPPSEPWPSDLGGGGDPTWTVGRSTTTTCGSLPTSERGTCGKPGHLP